MSEDTGTEETEETEGTGRDQHEGTKNTGTHGCAHRGAGRNGRRCGGEEIGRYKQASTSFACLYLPISSAPRRATRGPDGHPPCVPV